MSKILKWFDFKFKWLKWVLEFIGGNHDYIRFTISSLFWMKTAAMSLIYIRYHHRIRSYCMERCLKASKDKIQDTFDSWENWIWRNFRLNSGCQELDLIHWAITEDGQIEPNLTYLVKKENFLGLGLKYLYVFLIRWRQTMILQVARLFCKFAQI